MGRKREGKKGKKSLEKRRKKTDEIRQLVKLREGSGTGNIQNNSGKKGEGRRVFERGK